MACDNPLLAFRDSFGEVKIVGSLLSNYRLYSSFSGVDLGKNGISEWLFLPCGHCLSCRMSLAHMWSMRCRYELESHEDACFVTLTYRNADLPVDGSLQKEDYQKFLKRLRKRLDPQKIRYFGCGEYGLKKLRPHYHFIIFGWCPSDLKFFFKRGANIVYRSEFLEELWPHGFCSVGAVSDESIKYVCRYTMKKAFQDLPKSLLPSFTVCSSRPAIGRDWFLKNWRESLVKDESGAIVRYGFPDLSFNGHFFDVRYFRKLARQLADGRPERRIYDKAGNLVRIVPPVAPMSEFEDYSNDVDFHLRELKQDEPPISEDELKRRLSLSAERVSRTTHYGRLVPEEMLEEML